LGYGTLGASTNYGPKNLEMVWFPLIANGWGTKYPVLDIAPPLLAEEERPPT
jgi:hypothetical protein